MSLSQIGGNVPRKTRNRDRRRRVWSVHFPGGKVRKRKTKITVESHQVTVIRHSQASVRAWCAVCGEPVRMVTADQAAIVTGTSLRAVLRQVEADQLHFTETTEGRLFICLNSLMARGD